MILFLPDLAEKAGTRQKNIAAGQVQKSEYIVNDNSFV